MFSFSSWWVKRYLFCQPILNETKTRRYLHVWNFNFDRPITLVTVSVLLLLQEDNAYASTRIQSTKPLDLWPLLAQTFVFFFDSFDNPIKSKECFNLIWILSITRAVRLKCAVINIYVYFTVQWFKMIRSKAHCKMTKQRNYQLKW